jgi:hypothetical protein
MLLENRDYFNSDQCLTVLSTCRDIVNALAVTILHSYKGLHALSLVIFTTPLGLSLPFPFHR